MGWVADWHSLSFPFYFNYPQHKDTKRATLQLLESQYLTELNKPIFPCQQLQLCAPSLSSSHHFCSYNPPTIHICGCGWEGSRGWCERQVHRRCIIQQSQKLRIATAYRRFSTSAGRRGAIDRKVILHCDTMDRQGVIICHKPRRHLLFAQQQRQRCYPPWSH